MRTPLSVLLKEKGGTTYFVKPNQNCFDCVLQMNEHGIGALLVMDGELLIGIISERDIIRKVVGKKTDPAILSVTEIMTKELLTVPPTMTVQEAMKMITEKRIRHLPVVENGKLIGLISIGDLTKWVMLQQEHEIAALTGYIHGTP
jgi:CBS domain-containing protein